jgi:amidase
MPVNTVKVPTVEQLSEVAAELGFTFSADDLAAHREALLPSFDAYNLLDQMPDELPPVAYPRLPGRRPTPEENPHNGWWIKTEVAGVASGKLRGKTVALIGRASISPR